ncbi:acyl carrier protein phosphodiesterase [Marinifilum fragile]|uniref:acyl carrier protein phosphodiesterase n=1 Tax=Marinifilum fragile TaxID=570161 RepID=UPI0006D14AED|nr:ACP phosphodiesterase [Marinifilum fragile]
MNFLAHLYLSGDSEKVRVGNFIGDYVKGKNYEKYHPEIQKGIILHRNIDHFTDKHPLVLDSSKKLKEGYRRYSGVVVDLIFDHFLAKYWQDYHTLPIKDFVTNSHEALIKNYLLLPNKVKLFLPFLIQSRRLESYANIDGLQTALDIMARRTSLPDNSVYAIKSLEDNYSDFENKFKLFMKDILKYVSNEHNINVATPNGWHPNEGK